MDSLSQGKFRTCSAKSSGISCNVVGEDNRPHRRLAGPALAHQQNLYLQLAFTVQLLTIRKSQLSDLFFHTGLLCYFKENVQLINSTLEIAIFHHFQLSVICGASIARPAAKMILALCLAGCKPCRQQF
jgi:hypothetical protein